MTRTLGALTLLIGALTTFAPLPAASGHDGHDGAAVTAPDITTACVTRERGRKYVTHITRTSGRERVVNLRLKDRAFGGEYLWRAAGASGGLIVRCRVVDGVVRLTTNGGSRVWVVPPTPVTVPADNPAPPALATWDGPLTIHAPIGADWALDDAIASWNAGLPADRQMVRIQTPCAADDPYCMEVAVVAQVRADAWGIADWQMEGSRMTGCDIRISEQAPLDYRPNVLAHELGHCLGLPHWHFEGSIMYDYSTLVSEPTDHDVAWLAESYSQA